MPHTFFPTFPASVAATLGTAVGHAVGTPSTTVHWQPLTGGWFSNVNGASLGTATTICPDTLDQLGRRRPPAGGLHSVGAIQWQAHRFDTVILCHESAYTHRGRTYPQSGDYTDTIISTELDTVLHLHLLLDGDRDSIWQITACDSIVWYGTTYTGSTTAPTHLIPQATALGCDSIARLHLTITHATHNNHSATACDSYSWHNVPYAVSGIYTYAYTNTDGCPSIDTLHLTINHSNTATDVLTACDSLSWNGIT